MLQVAFVGTLHQAAPELDVVVDAIQAVAAVPRVKRVWVVLLSACHALGVPGVAPARVLPTAAQLRGCRKHFHTAIAAAAPYRAAFPGAHLLQGREHPVSLARNVDSSCHFASHPRHSWCPPILGNSAGKLAISPRGGHSARGRGDAPRFVRERCQTPQNRV